MGLPGPEGQTVRLKDADPIELQIFIEKLPASIKGKNTFFGSIFGYGGLGDDK